MHIVVKSRRRRLSEFHEDRRMDDYDVSEFCDDSIVSLSLARLSMLNPIDVRKTIKLRWYPNQQVRQWAPLLTVGNVPRDENLGIEPDIVTFLQDAR